MNHIYRRIWSAAKRCWVVGSELTKRGPAARRSVSVAASAAVLALSANAMAVEGAEKEDPGEETETIWNEQEDSRRSGMSMNPFMTGGLNAGLSLTSIAPQSTHYQLAIVNDVAYRDSTATGDDTVVVGSRSAISGRRSVGYGNGIRSTGEHNVAIGTNVKIEHWYATAVGDGAYAGGGWGATAYGNDSRADGGNAIAIGSGSRASTGGGIGGIALGGDARAGTSGYSGAIAVGNKSNASYDAMAIGYESRASVSGSVALGTRSVANETDTVSVGSSTLKRRVMNVKDARLTGSSSDAVTGSQLYWAKQDISRAQTAADTAKTNASTAQSTANTAKSTAENAMSAANAAGYLTASGSTVTSTQRAQASGTGALASGLNALASGSGASAHGYNAKANAIGSIAIGSGAKIEASSSNYGIAIGASASTGPTAYQVAIGYQASAAGGASSMALGASTKANHSRSVALGVLSVTTANDQVSIGSDSVKRTISGMKDGLLSATSTEGVTGKQLFETNAQVGEVERTAKAAQTAASTAKDEAGKALTATTVLGGLVGQVSATGNVRLGEKNSGTVLDVRNSANANRTIRGLKDGLLSATSTEGVTGKQLFETNAQVGEVDRTAKAAQTAADTAMDDAGTALTAATTLGGLVGQVSTTGNVRLGEKNSGTVLDMRNSAGANRKVSGVADAVLSTSSAEAVSGKQLYSTNSRVSDLEGVAQYVSIGSAPFSERAEAGVAGVAVGNSAKTELEGGTAVGTFAEAMGKNSTAIGRAATVSVDSENGFAMGVGAQVGGGAGGANEGVAIGAGARVGSGAHGSLALGNGSQAVEEGVASFGGVGVQRRLVNIARGTADHNAITVSQLKDSLDPLGGGAGMDANGNIIAPTYSVQSGTQNTVEDALMALDGAVITAGRRADKVEGQLGSIFQDSPSIRADGMNQITLNGVNGMVLTNLADGRVAPGSRDAVTGSQLYAAEQKISQNRKDLETMRKEREVGAQTMRGLDASGPIDFGGVRLTGVAEGKLSADSSDVVRGSQLYETNSRVSELEGVAQFVSIGSAPFSERAEAGVAGVAVGNSAKTGLDGGTAVGTFAEAMGKNSTAIGRGAAVSIDSENGFALGAGSQVGGDAGGARGGVAIGASARVGSGAHGSLALGNGSLANEDGVASFGGVGIKRRLVNIANGTANHNAATVGQLRGALSVLGGEVDANGNIVGPSFNVQGQSQSTLNGALEALDGAVVSTTSRVNHVESQLRSVFQDTPSVRADGTHQLTLAGANGMVISNVANGLIAAGSRDAVNGGQLHSMQQQLNGRMDGLEQRIDDQPQARAMAAASTPSPSTEEIAPTPETSGSPQIASTGEGDKPMPQPKSKQDDTPKPQVDTADLEKMLARANEYTDGAISTFERRLDKMDKRFNRMAAMSSAQSAMAMNTAGLATYNRLGAGVGYSEGESAMAVGYQRVLNEKGSATFSLNGAFTNSGERSMGVGVGIGW
ncbi:ESPR-type extended signal peptide-containing protein [Stenotrophomonas sp. Sm3212]|nr:MULTISPECIES: ESPR-type extended signal peptide-containing protein [Stenotrophomonas]MBC9093039.1 autotransporter [Stenotrophomonas maltophilia]MBH1520524.1 YadA-like family protein [Stenotrophomonas maltophilia]MCF3464842.1 autotransporter [Stenotrophomonas maltophilia]MCF3482164.1 autotransporter [Stenotrophomonas maltophilia]MCF3509360.1 autotransporter [Stenotrophomonas maltophilia]